MRFSKNSIRSRGNDGGSSTAKTGVAAVDSGQPIEKRLRPINGVGVGLAGWADRVVFLRDGRVVSEVAGGDDGRVADELRSQMLASERASTEVA